MAKQLQLRKGTTAEVSAFKGAEGELVVDTTKKQLVLQDGVTTGGIPVARQSDLDNFLVQYLTLPYPKNIPVSGYLVMMGQSINPSTYPILHSLYGSTLPDMRAYSIRGLDNGRGIDIGRIVLSQQEDAIRNIVGSTSGASDNQVTGDKYSGAFYRGGAVGVISTGTNWTVFGSNFDASRVVPTASENRVKNIAFLYIVKAG